jgi:hypothetical protein
MRVLDVQMKYRSEFCKVIIYVYCLEYSHVVCSEINSDVKD